MKVVTDLLLHITHASVTDYRKRKNVGWGLGSVHWLLTGCCNVGVVLRQMSLQGCCISGKITGDVLHERSLTFHISPEGPVMTF